MTFATQPDRATAPRLLLIEDNPFHQRLVTGMAREAFDSGAAIDLADCLGDGLVLLSEWSYDCVLLDLMLPDAVGLEGLHRILDDFPGVPVIVVSAHDDDDTAVRSVEEGAEDYLVKGVVDEVALRRSILHAIERSDRHMSPNHPAVIFSSLQEGLPTAGLAQLDRDGNLVSVDPGLCSIVGRKAAELAGVPVPVHPDDAPRFDDAFDRAAAAGESTTVRVRLAAANREPVMADVHVGAALGAEGGWLVHVAPLGSRSDHQTGTVPVDLGWQAAG